MYMLDVELIVAIGGGIVGTAVGWWMRGNPNASANKSIQDEIQDAISADDTDLPSNSKIQEMETRFALESQHTQEVMQQLRELSLSVKADVGQHNDRVREINDQLVSGGSSSATAESVFDSISKLVDANQNMQEQLASAEIKLIQQAEEIETHASEARTDALTGLANRRAFDDQLTQNVNQWNYNQLPTTLVMLDVDFFKKFNDTHGHQAGDEVLKGVAHTLEHSISSEGLVARYGGEEFAIVYSEKKIEQVKYSIERARAAIEAAVFSYEGKDLRVTVSQGVAETSDNEDPVSLIRKADDALYASKQAGRNCAHFHDGRDSQKLIVNEKKKADAKRFDSEDHQKSETKSLSKPNEVQKEEPLVSDIKSSPTYDSRTDPITGLPSRQAICEDIRRRLAETSRNEIAITLILLRIDRLDGIIQERGERTSEMVLKTVTRFLQAAMRDMDYIGRYDNDTFSLLLPSTGLGCGKGVAERLRSAIERCVLNSEKKEKLSLTVSIGISEASMGDDLQTILQRTESALTTATNEGGNQVFTLSGQSKNSTPIA